eukprot:268839-Rhodomonas_salina.1
MDTTVLPRALILMATHTSVDASLLDMVGAQQIYCCMATTTSYTMLLCKVLDDRALRVHNAQECVTGNGDQARLPVPFGPELHTAR